MPDIVWDMHGGLFLDCASEKLPFTRSGLCWPFLRKGSSGLGVDWEVKHGLGCAEPAYELDMGWA
jgi:hypothetical protein